jgi:hypothetical protein
LKHDDRAAAQIVEQLAQSGLEKVTLDGVRPVEAAIRYFRARLPRMQYAATRRESLPIGSGNVEATCKSLVSIHMKRPGARWKHTTGEEVMQLRALQLSDRWAPAVQRAIRPLAKPVQIATRLYAAKPPGPAADHRRLRNARRRVAAANHTAAKLENGSDEDRRRRAGFCKDLRILEPHPARVDRSPQPAT